jgi:HK97 family phage prohead protease
MRRGVAKERETKTFQGYTVKADAAVGIVEAYVNIFGIIDDSWMNDIVEPGAFKKTISERGPAGTNKIRVLWMHRVSEVIGKTLLLEEHSREQLPDAVRSRFPMASGGLFTKTKLVMEVQRGREAFALYDSGAMDEWSIGFDDMDSWLEERDKISIRHLREVRLWEYSPVTWGANPATTTVSVKSNLEMLLDEVRQQHPEYIDLELLRAVEQRLASVEPAGPVKPPTAKSEREIVSPSVWAHLLRLEKNISDKLKGFENGNSKCQS